MRRLLFPCFALAATMVHAQTGPADTLQPGAWTETVIVKVKTLQGAAPADPSSQIRSNDRCYTQADVADPKSLMLRGAGSRCTTSRFAMAGGTIRIAAECAIPSGPTLKIDLHGRYSPTGFDLSGTMRGAHEGPFEMTLAVQARRTGECAP